MIEQAIETAALMLGTDKSRGYCLEMICADFLTGAHLDNGNPEILLNSISRYYKFLPGEQQQASRTRSRGLGGAHKQGENLLILDNDSNGVKRSRTSRTTEMRSRSWRFARQPNSVSSAHAPAEIRFHCL